MGRGKRLDALPLFLALFFCAISVGTAAGETPPSPPGLMVRALVLERKGYRIGETPPPAAVYVATDAGVFGSSGESGWVSRDPGMGSGAVTTLAIFQRERPIPEPVIAHKTSVAYDTALYAGTSGKGVFRSEDGGASWRDVNEGLTDLTIQALLVDRAGTVYAGTAAGGLYRRGNADDRWSAVGTGLPRTVHALAADPVRARVVYLGAGAGLFRSRDGGKSWAALPVEPDSDFVVSSVAVDPTAPDTVVAAGRISCRACTASPVAALFKSVDGGGSWTRSPASVEGPLLFGPGDSSLLYARGKGEAVSSRDGASTWTAAEHGQRTLTAVLAIDADWPGRLYGRSAAGGLIRVEARCSPDAWTLCLQDGRFRVQVDWGSGSGASKRSVGASPQTTEAGSFWIERPSNVVLTVKIQDRRSLNGHFWLDYESKTSVGFTLEVTDVGTGGNTRYSHPEGQRTSFTDHAAF